MEEGGTLWFVFIGHGAPGREGNQGVLVGADAQADVDSLYARSVLQSEVLAALKEQPFGSKLLGRTKYLVGDAYVRADLPKAPRYYLLNFSGSF